MAYPVPAHRPARPQKKERKKEDGRRLDRFRGRTNGDSYAGYIFPARKLPSSALK